MYALAYTLVCLRVQLLFVDSVKLEVGVYFLKTGARDTVTKLAWPNHIPSR